MDFKATVLSNGDLEITLWDSEDRDELADMLADKTDMDILLEGFEHYFTNGSYHPFNAGDGNPFVGLTSDICIAESINFTDDGDAEIEGAFWHYPETYRYNIIEQLLENEKVIFKLVN